MPRPSSKDSGDRKVSIIRLIYLYLISAITFIVFLIGAISLVNLGLEVFVFDIDDDYYRYEPYASCEHLVAAPVVVGEVTGEKDMGQAYKDCMAKQKAIEEKKESRWISESHARDLSIGIAQVLVALPLWLFHWKTIERDRKKRKIRGRAK
jgi:hypothetical protein